MPQKHRRPQLLCAHAGRGEQYAKGVLQVRPRRMRLEQRVGALRRGTSRAQARANSRWFPRHGGDTCGEVITTCWIRMQTRWNRMLTHKPVEGERCWTRCRRTISPAPWLDDAVQRLTHDGYCSLGWGTQGSRKYGTDRASASPKLGQVRTEAWVRPAR